MASVSGSYTCSDQKPSGPLIRQRFAATSWISASWSAFPPAILASRKCRKEAPPSEGTNTSRPRIWDARRLEKAPSYRGTRSGSWWAKAARIRNLPSMASVRRQPDGVRPKPARGLKQGYDVLRRDLRLDIVDGGEDVSASGRQMPDRLHRPGPDFDRRAELKNPGVAASAPEGQVLAESLLESRRLHVPALCLHRVDDLDPSLDQIRQEGEDGAIGVNVYLGLAPFVDERADLRQTGLEDLAVQLGGDHRAVLGAKVVAQRGDVDPLAHQIEHPLPERKLVGHGPVEDLLVQVAFRHQVHQGLLRAAKGPRVLPGPGRSDRHHDRLLAVSVCPLHCLGQPPDTTGVERIGPGVGIQVGAGLGGRQRVRMVVEVVAALGHVVSRAPVVMEDVIHLVKVHLPGVGTAGGERDDIASEGFIDPGIELDGLEPVLAEDLLAARQAQMTLQGAVGIGMHRGMTAT